MEQITKRDGTFYYGNHRCIDVEDVYRHFRNGYNSSYGRAAFRFLNRLGSRMERVHEFGLVFDGPAASVECAGEDRLRLDLLGLVCGSYCWITREIPQQMTEQEQLDWFDMVLRKGSGMTWKTGKSRGSGRKDKRLKTRYR